MDFLLSRRIYNRVLDFFFRLVSLLFWFIHFSVWYNWRIKLNSSSIRKNRITRNNNFVFGRRNFEVGENY